VFHQNHPGRAIVGGVRALAPEPSSGPRIVLRIWEPPLNTSVSRLPRRIALGGQALRVEP